MLSYVREMNYKSTLSNKIKPNVLIFNQENIDIFICYLKL